MNELLRRHERFWTPATGDGPLLAECPHPDWRPKPYPLAGGARVWCATRIRPRDIDVGQLLAADRGILPLVNGDHINSTRPAYPVAWMEAVLGCPIYVTAASCSSRPAIDGGRGLSPAPDARRLRQSPWLGVMERVLEDEVAAAGSTHPAAQLHLRGVIDMLAAYLGEERLCLSVYDEPEELRRLAETFADLYIEIARKGLRSRPPWRGGYVSVWGVYAPGPLLDYQIDASGLFSLEAYERCFSPFDARVLSAFPFTVIHLHSCALHVVPAVLDTKGVRAVQISLDREAAAWRQEPVLEACQRIQGRGKSLLVCGELDEGELDDFLRRLDPGGLAIFYWKPRPA